ncbi:MAG: hypothetical protein ACLQIB_02645 [Isosphaeraceae bacterium]
MTTDTERSDSSSDPPPVLKKDWRFCAGMAALLLALFLPLLGLAVPPTATSAVLIGGLVAGGPEALMVLAVPLLGEQMLADGVPGTRTMADRRRLS